MDESELLAMSKKMARQRRGPLIGHGGLQRQDTDDSNHTQNGG